MCPLCTVFPVEDILACLLLYYYIYCIHTVLSPFGSAYTEPFPMNPVSAGLSADEDHGRTSEEEEGVGEQSFDRQVRFGIQRQREVHGMGG